MRVDMFCAVLALALAAACESTEPSVVTGPEPSAAGSAGHAPPLGSSADAPSEGLTLSAAELPLPDDFAPEATQQITKANYRAELAVLAEEIEQGAH